LKDHFGHFPTNFKNQILNLIPPGYTVYSEYFFPDEVKIAYPEFEFRFSAWLYNYGNHTYNMSELAAQTQKPELNFKNFLCCFNRSKNGSRYALLARLHELGWYNEKCCTKHFSIDFNQIKDSVKNPDAIDPTFLKSVNIFDFVCPLDHDKNFAVLSPIIQDCFLNLVSETISLDTLVPFPTEKFLYAIANRRLWVAVAPPDYHKMINQTFGFELYSCFNYNFDSVWDSRSRLETLLAMLDRFSHMTTEQWQEVYETQQQQIEYNYRHLASFGFFDQLGTKDQAPWPHTAHIGLVKDTAAKDWQRFVGQKQKN
jgi:hypothetical protein